MKKIKIILLIILIFAALLILGSLIFKTDNVTKLKMNLENNNFQNIEANQYERVISGLNQEDYLNSNDNSKQSTSIIFDLDLLHVIKNDSNFENSFETIRNLTLDLTTLEITGYYSNDEKDIFLTINYNIRDGKYICNSTLEQECLDFENFIYNFIDEVYIILDEVNFTLEDFSN